MQTQIPKKVHYIWFGKGEKSELIQHCIDKNKKVLPEWEFKEWNEDNYDIDSCPYMREAYDAKKYAFASDYARFDLLYRYGGVYLDTDVELMKPIPDEYMDSVGFCGVESNNRINGGLIFACTAGNPIVKEILEQYKRDKFRLEDGTYNLRTVVDRVTDIFEKYGFKTNGEQQTVQGFTIYPCEVFCAYDFVLDEFNITENTVSIHHYAATWVSWKSKLKKKIQKLIRTVFGKKFYLKLIRVKRKLFGESK